MQKEKVRRPNFTSREMNILVDEILQDPELGRGELGSKYQSISELRQGWDEIASKISASECFNRSGEEIKNKLGDMKTRTKKKAAAIRQLREATGGGEPSKLKLTDLEEKILQIVGAVAIYGLKEGIDMFDEPSTSENKEEKEINSSISEVFEVQTNITPVKKKLSKGKENIKKRIYKPMKQRRGLTARSVIQNQANILKEMKKTNYFLQKLIVLKKQEVDFLRSSCNPTYVS